MRIEREGSEYQPTNKIFTLDNIPFGSNEVTLVGGYFDLLHSGHVQFLRRCREIGNPLAVGVIAAEMTTKPGRPVMTDEERVIVVSGLGCVNYVFLDKYDYRTVVDAVKPRAIVFSSGEPPNQVKQEQIEFLTHNFPDLNVIHIPRQSYEISTTQIIHRIQSGRIDIFERETIRKDEMRRELENYAQRSNAEMKSAAFVVTDEDVVLAKGVNYHPEVSGNVIFTNTDTVEFRQSKPRPTHAEVDAIIQLVKSEVKSEVKDFGKLTICSLHMPCAGCAEIISRLGFKRVVYFNDFDNNYGENILKMNGVKLEKRG